MLRYLITLALVVFSVVMVRYADAAPTTSTDEARLAVAQGQRHTALAPTAPGERMVMPTTTDDVRLAAAHRRAVLPKTDFAQSRPVEWVSSSDEAREVAHPERFLSPRAWDTPAVVQPEPDACIAMTDENPCR